MIDVPVLLSVIIQLMFGSENYCTMYYDSNGACFPESKQDLVPSSGFHVSPIGLHDPGRTTRESSYMGLMQPRVSTPSQAIG